MNEHTYVVCAYGDSPYLKSCLQSLKSQTRLSKIILYTSTPSQYINDICEHYDIPLFTACGGGIGKDWNNALSFVETRYATIAHQDDIYHSTYGEKIFDRIHEESLILFSDYSEIKDDEVIKLTDNLKIKTLMLKVLSLFPKSRVWRNRILGFGNPICCPAVTYDLHQLRGFRFDEQLKVSLDWYAWYQIAQYKGRFEFVSERLMSHRIHEGSETTNNIENNNRTVEDFQMYQLFWPKWVARILLHFYVRSQETN